MENVLPRDNHGSLPSVTDSVPPFQKADPFLLTPNRRESSAEDTSPDFSSQLLYPRLAGLSSDPLRSKPLFRGFERPNFTRIAILAALCFITYPAFYILTLVARGRSLFIVRLIVAMWCSGVGFGLGYLLLKIGVQHLEAASE
jgi:hypothetical protein